MSVLEKEYRTAACRIRITSFLASEQINWKTGYVLVYFDETNSCWKIRVEVACSKQAVFCIRLRDQIKSVSLNMGKRLHVVLERNGAKIMAENLNNDSDSISKLKGVEFALKQIKEEGDPRRMTVKPLVEKQAHLERLSADEVANIVSAESSDDCFLFDEPATVFRHELNDHTPRTPPRGSGRKYRHVPTRGEAMVNKALDVMDKNRKNKENRIDENLKAANFYQSDSGRSPFGSGSNIRLTPKKTPDYSMRKSGLLSPPRSLSSRQSSTPLRQSLMFKSNPEFVGFSNLGNTCYMNAVLQALLGLAPFYWDLVQNGSQHRLMKEDGLYVSLLRLHQAKRRNLRNQTEYLKDVKRSISSTAKRFSGFEQHDAQEFLAQVMDQLNEEVQEQSKKDESDHQWLNPVIPNFEVEVEHSIKCSKCENVVNKTEQLYVLSVEVPSSLPNGSPGSIQSALDKFFSPENIEYKCEHCGHDKSTVYHEITKLPRILVIHLKRWYHDMESQDLSKISKPVFIPTFVTMLNHCTKETTRPRTPVNPNLTKALTMKTRKWPDDSQQVPDHTSSPIARNQGRSDDLDIGFPSPEPEDDLEKVMELSRREYEKNKLNTVLSDNAVDIMNEDEQLKAAMELSLMEAQPVSRGNLPEFQIWGGGERDTLDSDTEQASLPDTSNWIGRVQEGTTSFVNSSAVLGSGHQSTKSTPNEKRRHYSGMTPKKRSSSDLGSSDSDLVPNHCSASLTPDESSDPITSDNDYSPARIKRRSSESDQNTSNKSRRTDTAGPGVVVEERNIEYSMSLDQNEITGLKGGRPLDLDDFEIKEVCKNCEKNEENCTCYEGDDEKAAKTEHRKRKSPSLEIGSECMCEFYDDPSKCLIHRENPGGNNNNNDSTTPIKSVSSPSLMNKLTGSGLKSSLKTGYDPLDWLLEQSERIKADREIRANEIEDTFEADLKKATELSLGVQTTEEDILQQVLEQSKHEHDEAMRMALEASRLDLQKTPTKKTAIISPAVKARQYSGNSDKSPGDREQSSAEKGAKEYSYGLVSVVSHIGSTQFSGHYIADVYVPKKGWYSCNDSSVTKTNLNRVREEGRRSGYIFFFMAKEVCQEVAEQIDHPLLPDDNRRSGGKMRTSSTKEEINNNRNESGSVQTRDSCTSARRSFDFHRSFVR